jgi:hypothetical protein
MVSKTPTIVATNPPTPTTHPVKSPVMETSLAKGLGAERTNFPEKLGGSLFRLPRRSSGKPPLSEAKSYVWCMTVR